MKKLKFIENNGIMFFLISIMIMFQLRWAEKFDYDDIGLRITIAIILSISIFYVIKICIDKYIIGNENLVKLTNDISFSLSFSIFLICFHSDNEIIM